MVRTYTRRAHSRFSVVAAAIAEFLIARALTAP